jgi:hypothetical protein
MTVLYYQLFSHFLLSSTPNPSRATAHFLTLRRYLSALDAEIFLQLISPRCEPDGISHRCVNEARLPDRLFLRGDGKYHDSMAISSARPLNTNELNQYHQSLLNITMLVIDTNVTATQNGRLEFSMGLTALTVSYPCVRKPTAPKSIKDGSLRK